MEPDEKYTEKITFRVKKSTKTELGNKFDNPSEVMRSIAESLVDGNQTDEVACNA